jgi:hypothetical protein
MRPRPLRAVLTEGPGRISKTGGEVQSFVAYALQGFVDGLKEQIDTIRNEQLAVAWENYVYGQFRGKNPRRLRVNESWSRSWAPMAGQ